MLSRETQRGSVVRRLTRTTPDSEVKGTNEGVTTWARDARTFFTCDLGSADGAHNTVTWKIDKEQDPEFVTWGPQAGDARPQIVRRAAAETRAG